MKQRVGKVKTNTARGDVLRRVDALTKMDVVEIAKMGRVEPFESQGGVEL